jgi:hypothetical protein
MKLSELLPLTGNSSDKSRIWWKNGKYFAVDSHYDHAQFLADNYNMMGIPSEEIEELEENEDREQVAFSYGWARINISQTTIPYLLCGSIVVAKQALQWILNNSPDLMRIHIEVIKDNNYKTIILNSHNDILLFVKNKKIFENENNLLTLYHGGRDLESDYRDVKSHGKGRWEYGPGLYLTNDRETASRYARGGGRRMYQVTIDLTGARELNDVEIPLHEAIDFVERNIKGKARQEFIKYLRDGFERRGRITANNVVNLALNLEAIANSKTNILRQFLIDHGVDYAKVDSYGGRSAVEVYVVINPRIIKKVDKNS